MARRPTRMAGPALCGCRRRPDTSRRPGALRPAAGLHAAEPWPPRGFAAQEGQFVGKFLWGIEVALARCAIGLSRAVPPRCASWLGGTVTRWVGPLLPASRIALRNLALA